MIHGDAFNDMPEEYREYKEEEESLKYQQVTTEEQSEADKAIADGKPRWMHHDVLGWQYVVILENQYYRKPNPVLVYREAIDRGSSILENSMMLVNTDVEILPYGETPPPAVPEKPKPVASMYFKYDGGEWLHMAESIDVQNHLHEGVDHNGWKTFAHSRFFTFTVSGIGIDGSGLQVGMEGSLVVTLQHGGEIYEGDTNITRIDQVISGDKHECSSVSFDMERDEKKKLPYTPDLLPDAIPSLNRCPDCDNTLEQRSMPDGIEEWCAECNMRIGLKRRLTDTWKVSLSDDKELDQAEQSEYERHQKVMDWQSHDWARRPIDRDKSWDKIEMVCMACGARSKPNDHDVPHCRELEPTEAEAPMDPDKIRAELQRLSSMK